MAKYKTFDEYIKGEKIVRYLDIFKRCWNFATEAVEEKLTAHNSESVPCVNCGKLVKLSSIKWATCEECADI